MSPLAAEVICKPCNTEIVGQLAPHIRKALELCLHPKRPWSEDFGWASSANAAIRIRTHGIVNYCTPILSVWLAISDDRMPGCDEVLYQFVLVAPLSGCSHKRIIWQESPRLRVGCALSGPAVWAAPSENQCRPTGILTTDCHQAIRDLQLNANETGAVVLFVLIRTLPPACQRNRSRVGILHTISSAC